MTLFTAFAALTAVALGLVLYGEGTERGRIVLVFKPLASIGFIAAAWVAGAPESAYGQAVLVALVLSFLGDVFLIPKGARGWFLAGLVAFLLGHVAFAAAFVVAGVDPLWSVVALAVMVPIAGLVLRWLVPHVSDGMRRPVLAYVAVITAMATLAAGTVPVVQDLRIPIAAAMFFVSDLAVARQRFVASSFINRLWGMPLYYGAQLVFAATV